MSQACRPLISYLLTIPAEGRGKSGGVSPAVAAPGSGPTAFLGLSCRGPQTPGLPASQLLLQFGPLGSKRQQHTSRCEPGTNHSCWLSSWKGERVQNVRNQPEAESPACSVPEAGAEPQQKQTRVP